VIDDRPDTHMVDNDAGEQHNETIVRSVFLLLLLLLLFRARRMIGKLNENLIVCLNAQDSIQNVEIYLHFVLCRPSKESTVCSVSMTSSRMLTTQLARREEIPLSI